MIIQQSTASKHSQGINGHCCEGAWGRGQKEVFVDTEHCNINSFQGMNLSHTVFDKNGNGKTV